MKSSESVESFLFFFRRERGTYTRHAAGGGEGGAFLIVATHANLPCFLSIWRSHVRGHFLRKSSGILKTSLDFLMMNFLSPGRCCIFTIALKWDNVKSANGSYHRASIPLPHLKIIRRNGYTPAAGGGLRWTKNSSPLRLHAPPIPYKVQQVHRSKPP